MPTEPTHAATLPRNAAPPTKLDLHPDQRAWRQPVSRSCPSPLRDVLRLEQALAAPPWDPGWRSRVSIRLVALRGAFAEHVALTEGPDGCYTELLDQAPRLARRVRDLVREHDRISSALSELQRHVDAAEISIEEVRRRAGEVLRTLARHRQRGADLVYEAYATDIGGET